MRIKWNPSKSKSLRGGQVVIPPVQGMTQWGAGTKNNPVILVTGSDTVDLEASLLPKNGTVTWSIDPFPHGQSPLLRKSGNTTEVSTELIGEFTVTARCAEQKADWFVHFVSVVVLAKTVETQPSENIDPTVNCQKGRIAAFARWAFKADLELTDRNGPLKIKPDMIQIGVIQNQVDTDKHTIMARYVGEGTNKGKKLFLKEWNSDCPPFIDADNEFFPFYGKLGTSGLVRSVSAEDNPGGTFPAFVDQQGNAIGAMNTDNYFRLEAIKGECRFETTIAARSVFAPGAYAIVYELCWKLQLDITLAVDLKPSSTLDLDLYKYPDPLGTPSSPSAKNGTFDMVSPVAVKANVPVAYGIEIAGPKATDLQTVLSNSGF